MKKKKKEINLDEYDKSNVCVRNKYLLYKNNIDIFRDFFTLLHV